MDFSLSSKKPTSRTDAKDRSVSMDWQIDSEWVDVALTSKPTSSTSSTKKGRQSKSKTSSLGSGKMPDFYFLPASKAGKYCVVDNQIFRLRQKNVTSGYSYWACSIPTCSSWVLLDPQERKIVQSCREHNHDAKISRKDCKAFIRALKLALRENPQAEPVEIYEKTRLQWQDSNPENIASKDRPFQPSFEAVYLAMLNTRNDVAYGTKGARGSETPPKSEGLAHPTSTARSKKMKDTKTSPKGKVQNLLANSPTNIEEEWNTNFQKEANLSDFEDWLVDDINANIPAVVASPAKEPSGSAHKKTPVKKESVEPRLDLIEGDENGIWDSSTGQDGVSRRKYRKRPASSSIFTCPHCPYKSNRHFNVQRHERLAHSTKKPEFSCKECGTSYSLEYRLKLHIKAVHQGEGHHCHICNKTFETMTGLKSHIVTKHKNDDPKVHHDPPPELICKLCGRVFSTKSHLQKHTSTHVMIQPYRCCVCNKAFMEEAVWLSHQGACTDEFVVQCCLCSAFVPTADDLMMHMDVVHGRAEYSCHCGKTFPWKKSLLTHQQKCSLFLADRSI